MKKISIEEKAKRYDEVIEKVKSKIKNDKDHVLYEDDIIEIFPELKESDDEKTRKKIINYIKNSAYQVDNETYKSWITWLEKQGEQKPTDKVESKFKIGDWIVNNINNHSREILHIYDIRGDRYYFNGNIPLSWCIKECDEKSHLWTIQDAKEGDVLAFDDNTIVIFKDLYNSTTFHSYCHIEDGIFSISKDEMPGWWEGKGFVPATKEQCDLLFQKMKEAGYKLDT